ncbi:nucleoid-associated protein [Vibrio parahaemolyticus]|uniref:nucleoid-associated protein n=1 Tax=Vibrio harveyi group TaxID=717610 RepID=UPI00215F926E|nr:MULTISPECIES: nucleoid-associated protein [Vibrio harveyi group]EIA1588597.1 hypothetical protein [Vibrio parahaemolyticus]EIJ0976090.1 hypothetical protein [Vibrio parahaemolyticus]EIU6830683.1 hypothetical protein [Vibrio parahaemolyticus]ELB2163625.1 hypothetical protein [Vibrio parahaemolyticus]MCS0197264.1 nucleoid-associated protein [Vibrio alginolyticus]
MNTQSPAIQLTASTISPIKKVFVYDIDVSNSAPSYNVTNTTAVKGLNDFVIKISQETITNPNHKVFKFEPTSISKLTLERFLNSTSPADDQKLSMDLAVKLLEAEKETAGKVSHLNSLRKGSMVVCHFKSDARECLIVSKLDFESFIERNTYNKTQGLPEKNGVLKSCVINIEAGKLCEDVFLLDSNGAIASFWSRLFLQALPFVDDSLNTKRAYSRILFTFKGLATSSKVDYQRLKNNLIGYFSTNTTFSVTNLLDSLIGSYEPVSSKVDLGEIKDKINKLVVDRAFDGTFTIDDKEVKKQFRQTLKLDGEVTVTTKDNYNDRIYKKEIDGDLYMLIRTDSGLEEVQEYPSEDKENSDTQ